MRAIVTGAGSGIGKAVAVRFAQDARKRHAKAHLLLVDLAKDRLDAVAQELRDDGAEIATFTGDLTDPAVPPRIADQARSFGGLDVVVSNAGIIQRGTLCELSLEDYDRCFAINTRATWLLAKATYPLLRDARGTLIATGSVSARAPTPPLGAYAASKAALVMLVRQLALDWGPDGIRCNVVSPGSTHTAMTDARYSDPVLRADAERRNPLRMVGAPEHQAAVIAFLASADAAYITGEEIVVDGGMSANLMPAMAMGDPWKK